MANAKKCDRCGRFYEKPLSYGENELTVTQQQKHGYLTLDLCDECIRKLKSFLKGAELNDNR